MATGTPGTARRPARRAVTLVADSKFLAYVLRHSPAAIGVALDENGWISIDTLLAAAARHGRNIGRDTLAGSCSGGVGGRFSRLCADSAEHPGFLEHPGITGPAPGRVASPPYHSTRGVMYLRMALRGEIPAPAMIISPGECATHPHTTGRVPHPSGDVIPGIRTPIRISPPTLAEHLPWPRFSERTLRAGSSHLAGRSGPCRGIRSPSTRGSPPTSRRPCSPARWRRSGFHS
jgi:hypothetical protein